jgi:hypothetical protein
MFHYRAVFSSTHLVDLSFVILCNFFLYMTIFIYSFKFFFSNTCFYCSPILVNNFCVHLLNKLALYSVILSFILLSNWEVHISGVHLNVSSMLASKSRL